MISNLGMVFLLGSLAFFLAYGVILLLAVERVQRKKRQTLGELSEKLFHLNRLLIDTNQQLQQSEELFRTSVEIMPDSFGIYSAIRDQSGQIIDFCVEYINDAACLNNHMTREEQLGKRLCEILPGHRESSLFAEYCQVVETGQPLVKDELIYEDDYASEHLIRAFDIRVAKFKDGFVATWGDVTARRQLEEEYRQQKQELQALVENSPDIITRFDHELRYTYANLAHQKATGLKSEALIGKNLAEIWANSETQYPQWQATLQAAFQTGQTQIDEFSFLAADGTTHFYQIQVVPELTKDGCVGSILTVSRDLTRRKQAEEALRQKQEWLTLVQAAAKIGSFEWNIQTNINTWSNDPTVEGQPLFLNAAGKQLVGLTEETFCQVDHISEFFAAKDLAYLQQTILPTLKELGNWHGEFRLQNFVTKTLVPVFSNIFTIKDKKTGQPVALAMVSRDITAQKQIEDERAQLLVREQVARQQAESASRMKDEFLAIVSHELRSPLNGILGWSRLLRTRKLPADKTEQALVSIERNAQVQTQLIEDLLDISRIIQGKVRLNLCPTSLVLAIQAALDTVTPTASTKSIHIESRLDPQANIVSGDPDRLQQIFWNLLSNAVKFTPVEGRVEIRLEKVNNYAQIQVIDTGKGIRADFLPYIFQRFSQADATTTRTQGGLGLGLAIVRNLVELHGGTVSVASLGEGKGSTFTVHLPLLLSGLTHSQEELTIQRQTDWKTNFDLSGLKILAVDDEADAREFLKTALEQYGAVTVTAASSREAIQLMQSAKPDVL